MDIEELAQRHSIPAILRAVEGHRPVLEMGFGTGLIAGELLAAGVELEVVEGSPALCEEAQRRHSGLVVHESMFETFEPPHPFGAVLALHVLEHVDDPVVVAKQLGTWLEPGGVLVAVTPNAGSIHRHLGVRMGLHEHLDDLSPRDHLVGHRRVFTLDQLAGALEGAGYQVVDRFGYFVKPVANAQMLQWSREVLDGLNAISDVVPPELLANIGVVARRP
jgi:2-polyprenyl-3-methyl-5-hydroxy-6-metoxy-1,4-benzoquinol methylase